MRARAFPILVAGLVMSAGVGPVARADGPRIAPLAARQIALLSAWKAHRSSAEAKVASPLLFAISRARGELPAELAGIESLLPRGDGRIEVDLRLAPGTAVEPVLDRLAELAAKTETVSTTHGEIRAWVPLLRLPELAAIAGVRRIEPARLAFTHLVVSEGDRTHEADRARNLYGVAGRGRKVCVLSDGIDSLAIAQGDGELPAVDVVAGEEGSGDEGTAMLEIVHDLAPAATLGFATAFNGMGSFADNIEALAARGCDVVVDDVIYLVESPFQDGEIAAAVDAVAAQGVAYASSAGNEGNLDDGTSGTWEGDFHANGTLPPIGPAVVHDFGDGGQSVLVTRTAPAVTLHWTDVFGASANDYDLYVLDGALSQVLRFSNDTQNGTGDPVEIIALFGVGAHVGERIVVARAAGADRLFNLEAFRGHLAIATAGSTRGHSAAAGALSIAAVPAAAPHGAGEPSGPYPNAYDASQLSELFTSDGPRRIFFDAAGALLPGAPPGDFSSTGGIVRAKPDLAAADGVSTSIEGFSPFFGTSASAPHVGAIAALVREAFPGFSPAELADTLRANALDVEAPGNDRDTGAGIAEPLATLAALGAPLRATLALASLDQVEVEGNGDSILDPGELWAITPTIENVGGAAATGIVASLVAENGGVRVRLGTVRLPDLAPGVSIRAPESFLVEPIPELPCGAKLGFRIEVAFAGGASPAVFPFSRVAGSAGTQVSFAYAGPPVPIPDAIHQGQPGPEAIAAIDVGAIDGRLVDVDFSFDGSLCTIQIPSTTVGLQHPFVADLVVELESPHGTRVTVIRRADGFGNNFCQTYLDDESAGPSIQTVETPDNPFTGSYRPASALAAFAGEAAPGRWTLHVTDWNPIDTGVIRAFSIHLTPGVCHVFARPDFVDVPALSTAGAVAATLALAGAALASLARRRRAGIARGRQTRHDVFSLLPDSREPGVEALIPGTASAAGEGRDRTSDGGDPSR